MELLSQNLRILGKELREQLDYVPGTDVGGVINVTKFRAQERLQRHWTKYMWEYTACACAIAIYALKK